MSQDRTCGHRPVRILHANWRYTRARWPMTVAQIAEALGGSKSLHREVGTSSDLVRLTRDGLPAEILVTLARELNLDRGTLARVIGIPQRTLSRRLSAHKRLSPEESDRTVRFARLLAMATETLGSREKASHWLQSPNRTLEGRTPLELLDTDAGAQSIETILGRIAYGVYS